jgi:Flp pilus assembly protein TadG
MPQPHTNKLKNERGQTMVEFALVLPILALLLFGVIQFGIAFNNYITLTDAVRAGARKAAVSGDATDPVGTTTTEVKNSAGGLDTSQLNVSVSSTWQTGSDVTVQATYPYSIHLLGLYDFSGQLTSKTTERVE